MRQTLERYVHLYNHQLPQSALQSRTLMQQMKRWYDERSELFRRQPRESNRPGCDSYEKHSQTGLMQTLSNSHYLLSFL